jgi:cellulose synthase/poly-beta-1,6-N-acetylglucosamine synthase-like glycosyltransferase
MIDPLEILFLFLTSVMLVYLVRHYLFTLTVLRIFATNAKTTNEPSSLAGGYEPFVSILIPARDEERVIGRLLQRMVDLTYSKNKLEVIVVDDASTDDTEKVVRDFCSKYGFIKLVRRDRKVGGKGKSAAMNHGYQHAKGDIILCFDADYYPQKDIVENLVREFIDPKVGAVQGRVVVLNEPENMVTRLIALERIGGYRVDQEARDILGLIPQFGGTVGGFRRSVLDLLAGWDESVLAEDTDLTFRVYLAGYRVSYVVNAECYEEAVDNWRAYRKQRYRWALGHMDCFFRHSTKVLLSPNLKLKEKVDGLLLLGVYFMPLVALLAFIVGITILLLKTSWLVSTLWFSVPVSFYSFVGNFAPFFEVGIGAYLDGRKRTLWLVPLLIFTFVNNMPICLDAFLHLLASKMRGKRRFEWSKTRHSGKGNCYIEN